MSCCGSGSFHCVKRAAWRVSQVGREGKQQECGVPVGPLAGGRYRCEPSPILRFIKMPRSHGWEQTEVVEIWALTNGGQKIRHHSVTKTGAEKAPRPELRPTQSPLPSATPHRMGGLLKAGAWLGLHRGGCEESSGSWFGQEDWGCCEEAPWVVQTEQKQRYDTFSSQQYSRR